MAMSDKQIAEMQTKSSLRKLNPVNVERVCRDVDLLLADRADLSAEAATLRAEVERLRDVVDMLAGACRKVAGRLNDRGILCQRTGRLGSAAVSLELANELADALAAVDPPPPEPAPREPEPAKLVLDTRNAMMFPVGDANAAAHVGPMSVPYGLLSPEPAPRPPTADRLAEAVRALLAVYDEPFAPGVDGRCTAAIAEARAALAEHDAGRAADGPGADGPKGGG